MPQLVQVLLNLKLGQGYLKKLQKGHQEAEAQKYLPNLKRQKEEGKFKKQLKSK